MSSRGMSVETEMKLAYEAKLEKMKQEALVAHTERVIRNKEHSIQKQKEYSEIYESEKKAEKEKIAEYKLKEIIYTPKEPEFILCVRVKGINKIDPKVKKTLEILRLKKPNHAVLVRNTYPVRRMLQKVKCFIAYGFADVKLVRDLVYKRGMAKVDGSRVNLTNEVVEDHFKGQIRSIEELIYQIVKGTPLQTQAANFLWPFTLQPPRNGFGGRKIKDVIEGGSTGNHNYSIGDLVKRMIE